MDFMTSKNVGGIGAILIIVGPLIGFVFSWAGLLSLVGIIMVLVAFKGLADYYSESGIFNNALYGFITTIVGGIAFVGVLIASVLMAITDLFEGLDWTNPEDWTTTFSESLLDPSAILNLLGAIIIAFIVLFIVIVISALFYRRSFNLTASESGVGMFGTAGLILLIGAILSIVLVGFIICWVAIILLAVAFFSLKPKTESPPTPEPSPV